MARHPALHCGGCDRCVVLRIDAVQVNGVASASRTCPECGRSWTQPVDEHIDVDDIVRVDLPSGTVYGFVTAVRGNAITIRTEPDGDYAGGEHITTERVRVLVY